MSGHSHHIVSVSMCIKVWLSLLVLSVVTVAAAQVDLGLMNFPLAMLIATAKAALVVFFFMGLKYDSNENRVIFFSSFFNFYLFFLLS